jgi:hypothetical protein
MFEPMKEANDINTMTQILNAQENHDPILASYLLMKMSKHRCGK